MAIRWTDSRRRATDYVHGEFAHRLRAPFRCRAAQPRRRSIPERAIHRHRQRTLEQVRRNPREFANLAMQRRCFDAPWGFLAEHLTIQ